MKINKNMVAGFVLFLVILINYANIFSNEFVWDDEFFVENNINIRSFENVPEFFSEPSPGNLYRPLRSVFYTVTYSIWELNVFGYHLNSLLLHFFVTLILFFITLKISNKFSFSFVVSLFFAAHPIHTARVTNMTASFDILGILFLLLSLFFYILHSKNDKRIYYYLSIFVYLFAIFSSEEAITLVLLLGLYDFSFNHKITFQNFKLVLKKYTPYILISIFYVSLRFKVLGQVGRETSYFNESFIGTFLTTFKVFVTYIYLLIFPVNLSIEHSPKFVTTVFDVPFLISLFIILGLIFVLIKSYKKSKLTFFSLGWFFITLIPFSNLFPQVGIMAERYLYIPSFGFCLLLVLAIINIKKISSIKKYNKIISLILIITLLVFYSFSTIERNKEWKDGLTLYSSDIVKNPIGTKLNEGLALELKKTQDYDAALILAQRAVDLSSKNYKAYALIGNLYAEKGNYFEAIYYYNMSIKINQEYYRAYNDLGLIYGYIEDYELSIYYLKKAIEINPKLSKAYNDLGTIYAQLGRFDEAIVTMEKSIEINPYEPDYHYNLAVIYDFLGENDKAKFLFKTVLALDPDNQKVLEKLNRLK